VPMRIVLKEFLASALLVRSYRNYRVKLQGDASKKRAGESVLL